MNPQNGQPVAYTMFCDDLRQEAGNKISYMGVYQGMMFVQAFPFTLPKLCAAVTVRFPRERIPSSLAFKLLLEDDVIAECSLDPALVASKQPNDHEMNAIFATALFHIAPLAINQPASLNSRVCFDDDELDAGALRIRLPQQTGDSLAD